MAGGGKSEKEEMRERSGRMWGVGSARSRGKEEPRSGSEYEWPRLMVSEKDTWVGMLCSEQSQALVAPSSFTYVAPL